MDTSLTGIIYLHFPTLLAAFGIVVYMFCEGGNSKRQNKIIVALLLSCALLSISDIIKVRLDEYYSPYNPMFLTGKVRSVLECVDAAGNPIKNYLWLFYFLAALCYILRMLISVLFWILNKDENKKYGIAYYIPFLVISALFATSFATKLCYRYATVVFFFSRGPLYWTIYACIAFYFILVAKESVSKFKEEHNYKELVFVVFFFASTIAASILEMQRSVATYSILTSSYVIDTMFYYAFLNSGAQKKTIMEKEQQLIDKENALRLSQIKPHFIYNTLNSIAGLCTLDPEKARELTLDFSDYLRTNLNQNKQNAMISFEEELKHVDVYLKIEETRFNYLRVEKNINCTDFSVPFLSIQPLVENAVKHGVCKKSKGGTVTISSEEKDNYYVVTIKDDGAGFDTEILDNMENDHVGIINVRERLREMCGGRLELSSFPGQGTEATVYISKELKG